MVGIILAGGMGTRLYPTTLSVSKQLVPIYDKPLIYYPLSTLMLAGIKEILIIASPIDINKFKTLFNNGSHLGLNIEYEVQEKPRGLADAFILGEKFIGNRNVTLILGDNLFFGNGLKDQLVETVMKCKLNKTNYVFGSYVKDPERFGVVEFSDDFKIKSIKEKPKKPKSNYALVGLYVYTNDVIKIAKKVKPSKRGEIEITSINNYFLKKDKLELSILNRGIAWLDTGNASALMDATNFVGNYQIRTGLMISNIEEIAFLQNFISKIQLKNYLKDKPRNNYFNYLRDLFK
jgi:glucose-1-phosphate thymidylyltransferase